MHAWAPPQTNCIRTTGCSFVRKSCGKRVPQFKTQGGTDVGGRQVFYIKAYGNMFTYNNIVIMTVRVFIWMPTLWNLFHSLYLLLPDNNPPPPARNVSSTKLGSLFCSLYLEQDWHLGGTQSVFVRQMKVYSMHCLTWSSNTPSSLWYCHCIHFTKDDAALLSDRKSLGQDHIAKRQQV